MLGGLCVSILSPVCRNVEGWKCLTQHPHQDDVRGDSPVLHFQVRTNFRIPITGNFVSNLREIDTTIKYVVHSSVSKAALLHRNHIDRFRSQMSF